MQKGTRVMPRKQAIEQAFLANLIEQERQGNGIVVNFKIKKQNNHKGRHHR